MTPRQGQRQPDWDAAHKRAAANIQLIVEREQKKGDNDERDHGKPAVSKP
jgi:hypothetical protein